VNDRTNGLKELIHILKHNRGKSSLEDIGNKAYLALCDTLFQCMRDERSAFLRSKKNTNKIALVLTLSATALRQIIDSGVRTIKSSTVESIIDSIIEVLPGKDGTLFEPLLEDLSKAMRELLKYQPHVERLSRECWNSAVDFCIESLSGFMLATDSATHDSWSTGVSSRGRTPIESTDLTGRTSSRDHSGKKQISDKHVHTAEDFVLCLQLLVKASNAPVLDKVVDILNSLLNFLQRKPTRGHSAALAAVNFIFARISLHAAQLTKRTIQELLPSLTQMWSDASLRDEILITLTHTEPHLASLVADRFMEQTTIDLEGLIDVMYADYRRRQESTVLHFLEDDHLCFRHIGKAQADTHPLHTCAFSLEHEHVRCESLWATISAIARFSFMIDDRKRTLSQRREDGEESTTKKLRVTRHFHDYLRHVSEPRSNAKRAALQVVAFMVQEGPMDEEDLQSTLERLTACISDENPVHSSWAMVALVS
jgi:ataxia telangiectasia mutated family protein